MPIYWDKGRKCWRFEYDRVIEGQRARSTKMLPATWSRSEADAFDIKESARLHARATGVERHRPTIAEAVTGYLNEHAANLKGAKSAAEHLAVVAWAYQNAFVDELAHVAAEITKHGREQQWGPATIKNRIAYVRAACRWAWKRYNWQIEEPGRRIALPAVRNERHTYIDRAQMLLIAQACPNRQARALIRIAYYSGLRRGELWTARVDGDDLVLMDTKNSQPRRVPIHPRIMACLRYLPPTIAQPTLRKWFLVAREGAGLAHVNFHDLRHSAASGMINEGVDLFTVGAVLGHKDARSTARYSHLAMDRLREAVGKIGRKPSKNPHADKPEAKKKAA